MSKFTVDLPGGNFGMICETDHGKNYYLFKVLVQYPDLAGGTQEFVVTVYVLSDCKENAINMARCQLKIATYEVEDTQEAKIKCIAKKVPLTIQGWGRNEVK